MTLKYALHSLLRNQILIMNFLKTEGRPVCFVFERAMAPLFGVFGLAVKSTGLKHFLFGKGHPMRKL